MTKDGDLSPAAAEEFLGDAEMPRPRGRTKSITHPIVIEDLEPRKPRGAAGDPSLSRADQILFAYMSRGLEMLNAISSCSKLPVAMRQKAAETMVEYGSAIFRGSKTTAKALPPPPPHFGPESIPPATAFSTLSPEAEQIPDGWGSELSGDSEAPPADFVPEPLPPPPQDRNIAEDAQIKNRCEERVLRMIQKYRVCNLTKLKGAVMGDRFGNPPLMDLGLLLQDMLAKGVIAKHTDTSGKVSYYLRNRPPLPVPAFRAQS